MTNYTTLNPSLPIGTTIIANETKIFTDFTLPIGVWIVSYAIRLKTDSVTASTIRSFSTWFGISGNTTYPAQQGSSSNQLIDSTANSLFTSSSFVIALSSSATINVLMYINTGSTIVGNILHYPNSNYIQYVRIG